MAVVSNDVPIPAGTGMNRYQHIHFEKNLTQEELEILAEEERRKAEEEACRKAEEAAKKAQEEEEEEDLETLDLLADDEEESDSQTDVKDQDVVEFDIVPDEE